MSVYDNQIHLCLHGLPRGNKAVWRSITENLIIPNNITKISIHCWTKPATPNTHHGYQDHSAKLLSQYLTYFCDTHNAKVLVEKQNLHNPEVVDTIYGPINHSNRINSLISQLRVIEQASNTRSILLCRSDVLFHKPVNLLLSNTDYWHHSGLYSENNKRYEFEDVLMYFPQNPASEYKTMIENHLNLNAYKENIYNSQLHYLSSQNHQFTHIKYGDDFVISRNKSIKNHITDSYYFIRKKLGKLRRKVWNS